MRRERIPCSFAWILLASFLFGAETAPPGGLDQAKSWIKDGRYAEAESLARVIIHDERDPLPRALALDVLVQALYRGGKGSTNEARTSAEEAVALKEQALGPSSLGVATSLGHLGWVLYEQNALAEARSVLERALSIHENTSPPDTLAWSVTLDRLASVLQDLGDSRRARSIYEQGITLIETSFGPEHPALAPKLYNYGRLLLREGEYEQAESVSIRGLSIAERTRGPTHPLCGWIQNNLGSLYSEIGRYADARTRYENALAIGRTSLPPGHSFIASCENNLAYLYTSLGDYVEAREIYARSLDALMAANGPRNRFTASAQANLAGIELRLGRPELAEPLFRKALETQEAIFGADHAEVATTLQGLADLLIRTDRPREALQALERARTILVTALGAKDHHMVALHFALGTAHAALGEGSEAGWDFTTALAVGDTCWGSDHPFLAEVASGYAGWLASEKQYNAAKSQALRAASISRASLEATASTLPERQALRYASIERTGLDLAISLTASGRVPVVETWDSVIRSRALVLEEMIARRRSRQDIRHEPSTSLERDLEETSRRVAGLFLSGPAENPQVYRERLRAAFLARETAERRAAEASSRTRHQIRKREIGIQQVRDALPPRAALVAYYQCNSTVGGHGKALAPDPAFYVAFVLSPEPRVMRLGSVQEIDDLVNRWREHVATPPGGADMAVVEKEYRQAGDALRRRIWDPIRPWVKGSDSVFLVPDGGLQLVSFTTLPLEDGSYWLETGPLIQYLTAERELVREGEAGAGGKGILLVGGIDFDHGGIDAEQAADARPVPLGQRFRPLPHTRIEVEAVSSIWNTTHPKENTGASVVLLTGSEATEARVKQAAAGKEFLHLATHGFYLEDAGERLGLPGGGDLALRGLGGMSPLSSLVPMPIGETSVLGSALALAGANQGWHGDPSAEDGFLTAEEVARLDLSGTDWVVLSACQTGRGRIEPGEGVLGLRRSFRIAGARTVLMTLWDVQDEAAERFMNVAYAARLQDHRPTAESVRQAGRAVLAWTRASRHTAHPFTWGAFVASGDWD